MFSIIFEYHTDDGKREREAVKKKRDYSQAKAVCKLILHYLPEFKFEPETNFIMIKSFRSATNIG